MCGKSFLLQHYPSNLSFGSYYTGYRWFSATLETHCWHTEPLDPNDESIPTQNTHSWSPYLKHLLPVAEWSIGPWTSQWHQVDVLSLIGRMLSDMGTASDWSKPMPYMDVAVVWCLALTVDTLPSESDSEQSLQAVQLISLLCVQISLKEAHWMLKTVWL